MSAARECAVAQEAWNDFLCEMTGKYGSRIVAMYPKDLTLEEQNRSTLLFGDLLQARSHRMYGELDNG